MRVLLALLAAALLLPVGASAGTVFLLDGKGYGHGVGMSQWGAEGYARHGFGYRSILAHYYPHTIVSVVPDRTVRVLLARAQTRVRVGSTAPFLVVDAAGRKLHLPARSVVVDGRLSLGGRVLKAPLRFEPGAQPLQYDFAPYRGELVVSRRAPGLLVVNDLPLDRYLRGVVPSELPKGWHAAAYEAQAVAARSYALATLHPGADFDLYPDDRSQVYGGVRAERTGTDLALGATAGQVLEYRGRVIEAFYSSSSGGRTSSVHDAWPQLPQVPYLVSVKDPFDYISPHHTWPTRLYTAEQLGAKLGLTGVRDARVVHNSSGRAKALRVLSSSGWHTLPGAVVWRRLRLDSNDFDLGAMSLSSPPRGAVYATRVQIHGWVRGLGRARLEAWQDGAWRQVARLHPTPAGRFTVNLVAGRSTRLRLAYNGIAGAAVPLLVSPRIRVRSRGGRLTVAVAPRLPVQVQRLTDRTWRPVARRTGSFAASLRPGSYRVAVLGGPAFLDRISAPVGVRATG